MIMIMMIFSHAVPAVPPRLPLTFFLAASGSQILFFSSASTTAQLLASTDYV
jgi:hypothetical protein